MKNNLMRRHRQAKENWETEYKDGKWQILTGETEFAHYSAVASYIQKHKAPYTLFDVGCGEGVILKFLNRENISSYTGLDIAKNALEKISPKVPADNYICGSLESYQPDNYWDVILFNEILYYTDDPILQIKKFEPFLKTDGFFLFSMHKKKFPFSLNNRCIRKVINYLKQTNYYIYDAIEVRKIFYNCSWVIIMAKPCNLNR